MNILEGHFLFTLQSTLGQLRGILFTVTLLAATFLAGCVAVVDSPTPHPGLEVYGNTEPHDARATSKLPFRLIALRDELVPGVLLHLVEPESFSTPFEQAFTDAEISNEKQHLLSIPPSSHATQRFHIWAGATVPAGPKTDKANADHVILLGQPNSDTVYRITVAKKNTEIHKLDLKLVRAQLSNARKSNAEDGVPQDTWPYSTALENKRFWKRIPWTPTDDIRGTFEEYESNTNKLGLVFSPALGSTES